MHITGDHLFVCCRDEQASKSLTRRIKASLDPHGLFNPGRLPGGT